MKERARKPKSTVARRGPESAPAATEEAGIESELRELRSSIASLRAAAEALDATKGRRRGTDAALLRAIVEEARRASDAVDALALETARAEPRRAGSVSGAASRVVAEIRRRAALDLDLTIVVAESTDARIPAPPELLAAVLGVLGLLRRDFGIGEAVVSTRLHDSLLSIDFAFAAREPEATRLADRHSELLGGEPGGGPGLARAAQSAGGEAWLALRRGEPTFSLRILLPRAGVR